MDNRPIGVMDSGAGGLTVAGVLHRRYPDEGIVYIGDAARNPYGERTAEEICRFAGEMKTFLLKKQVKMIIIACNTITFNVPPSFYEGPVPVVGMSLDFSDLPKGHKADVFATPASIATHRHGNAVKRFVPGANVTEVPCYGLAHAIETGAAEKDIEAIISNLIHEYHAEGADEAIFGCTHYPLVMDVFRRLMPSTFFLDPAEMTVKKAAEILREREAFASQPEKQEFYFTAEGKAAERLVAQSMDEDFPVHIAVLTEE